ncbi:MAG: ABC transporter substrate-binding protein, partial [Proteobacteria bacterium]|nr:ABC transporter substrate-binding protein [Pseudomonadota bacterium]
MMVHGGLKADDASFVGIGATSSAVAAVRRGEIDAIVNADLVITMLANENLIKIVADTRTQAGTQAVYGGPYPAAVLYTTPAYLEKSPRAAQALVNALVRGLKWIASHSPEEIAKVMPESYALGNRELYVRAITASKSMYSPDGRFTRGAAETALNVLKTFDPAVKNATIDLAKTYTESLVAKVGQ